MVVKLCAAVPRTKCFTKSMFVPLSFLQERLQLQPQSKNKPNALLHAIHTDTPPLPPPPPTHTH